MVVALAVRQVHVGGLGLVIVDLTFLATRCPSVKCKLRYKDGQTTYILH